MGRDGTVAALAAQLPQRRLVTLTGPGGIGKTTVALAVAREVAASYPDGVAFVDLAPVGDPRLVPGAIAAALGLAAGSDDPTAAVVAFLRGRRLLLLLDNCEHVVEAVAPAAEDVVRGAPDVHVLATSREPLRAAGERVHRLAPLEAPSASAGLTAAEALTFPGVQLFVERAAEGVDGFGLGDADAPLVADICRRLDGVPLAIELAAGRVDAFGVRGLAAHLDDRFRLLTTGRRTALPRHQTLAATLDWSHDLLPGAERALLRRLAVFAGDFSLEAAIALAPDQPPSEVVAHVADLVAKSLVAADHRGEAVRYRLLDTTRLYGLERLRESGELRGDPPPPRRALPRLLRAGRGRVRDAEQGRVAGRLRAPHRQRAGGARLGVLRGGRSRGRRGAHGGGGAALGPALADGRVPRPGRARPGEHRRGHGRGRARPHEALRRAGLGADVRGRPRARGRRGLGGGAGAGGAARGHGAASCGRSGASGSTT